MEKKLYTPTHDDVVNTLHLEFENADGELKEVIRYALACVLFVRESEMLSECAYCRAPMYTTVRAHHHTEVIDGRVQDVTQAHGV